MYWKCLQITNWRNVAEKRLKDFKIGSAGLGALVNHPADATAKKVAFENNLDLDQHIARQVTKDICKEYDLILVMEKNI